MQGDTYVVEERVIVVPFRVSPCPTSLARHTGHGTCESHLRSSVPVPNGTRRVPPTQFSPRTKWHTSTQPTGNRAPAPTATPPGAHPQRPVRTSPSPTRIRAPAPTATPPGARPQRRMHTVFDMDHGQPHSRAHFNTSRCPPSAAWLQILYSCHGQPCSRAHCKTSRCRPPSEFTT